MKRHKKMKRREEIQIDEEFREERRHKEMGLIDDVVGRPKIGQMSWPNMGLVDGLNLT